MGTLQLNSNPHCPMTAASPSPLPTTWRAQVAIPLLHESHVEYYNPQVEEWAPELMAIENAAKQEAAVLLFVIDNLTRSLMSMLEAVELIMAGRNVVVCVADISVGQEIGGSFCDATEAKDLNRARDYLRDVATRK